MSSFHRAFRRACGAAALALLAAVVPAAPAGATAEHLDQEFTGSSIYTVRCASGNEPGDPWATDPAVALVPERSGGLTRIRTQVLLLGTVDPAATVTVRVREDAPGGPHSEVLASRTLTAAEVLAAPAGLSHPTYGTAHVLDVTPAAPLGIAADSRLWLSIEREGAVSDTDFCFAVTEAPQEQEWNNVWFYNGAYAGYSTQSTRSVGQVVVLSDYLAPVGTSLTATPYLAASTYDPVRGYEAWLSTTGARVTSLPGALVEFRSGGTLVCTATTNSGGYAYCPDTIVPPVHGYTVTFSGDDLLLPSSAYAPLI